MSSKRIFENITFRHVFIIKGGNPILREELII